MTLWLVCFLALLNILMLAYLLFRFKAPQKENQQLKQKELQLEKELSVLETEKRQWTENLTKQEADYIEKLSSKDKLMEEKEQSFEEKRQEQKNLFTEKLNDKDKQMQEKEKLFKEKIQEQDKYFKEKEEQFQAKFELLSNKIFSENTKSYREETTKNLTQILQPFQQDIEGFKKSILSFENKGEFLDKTLQEFSQINKQMSEQSSNLEQALKGDARMQGQWGEFILENILQKSGLRKGEEFDTQVELKDNKGRSYRADAVVKLPDNKFIIIDSKASFKYYMDYHSTKNQTEKETALKNLLRAVENHIKNLSPKQYHFLSHNSQREFKTPDFTLMFIPNEGIFSLITQIQNLFETAWSQSIVLVSPTNLYASLRTIASIWKIERQNKNAQKIAEESGKMYDKFYNFVKDIKEIDKNINQAKKSCDSAFNKLEGRGSLASKIEKIKKLGANAKKDLKDHFDSEELETAGNPTAKLENKITSIAAKN